MCQNGCPYEDTWTGDCTTGFTVCILPDDFSIEEAAQKEINDTVEKRLAEDSDLTREGVLDEIWQELTFYGDNNERNRLFIGLIQEELGIE